jgi:type IV pilus assembly protein PilW
MSAPIVQPSRERRHSQQGLTLIELMVALVISGLLILGAVSVYVQSRNTYRVNESVARLQETARYALDVVDAEVRMANYWGLNSRADLVQNRAAPADDLPGDLLTAAGGIDECGVNWAIDVERYVEAAETYGGALLCPAFNNNPMAGADVLTVRRAASVLPDPLNVNRLYIQTSRLQSTIFIPTCNDPLDAGCLPGGFSPPLSESHELVATAFYIDRDSTGRVGVPSLRRKRLVAGSAAGASLKADIVDEEVIPGIEDLQVRYGLDQDGDGNADNYVDPAGVDLTDPVNRVVAVRIWLLARAEDPEVGFTDNEAREFPPGRNVPAPNDGIRRVLVQRTIQIRNTTI